MKHGLIRSLIRLLMMSASERAYFDACESRPTLSDADFHRRFYADTEIAQETCAGVRRVLCEQLQMCNTLPDDNFGLVFEDVDLAEVCFEIGDEFGVRFPDYALAKIDGTVDSLIRTTQRLIGASM